MHAVRRHIGVVRFGLPAAVGHEVDDALRIQTEGPFPVRERRFRCPVVVLRAVERSLVLRFIVPAEVAEVKVPGILVLLGEVGAAEVSGLRRN